MAKRRYVKVGDPSIFTYITDESAKRYDPKRAGWVLEETASHPTPVDVQNFMEDKSSKGCSEEKPCKTIEVETEKAGADPEEVKAEITDCSTVPTSKLADFIKNLNTESVQNIIDNDERKTAIAIAQKEIQNRK